MMDARRLSQALIQHTTPTRQFFVYRRKVQFTSDWITRRITPSKRWAKHLEHWATAIQYRKTQQSWLISQVSNAVWCWSIRTSIKAWNVSMRFLNDDLPLLGSWTLFNKLAPNVKYEAVVQEYLPVNPHPPDHAICKEYLDFLLEVIDKLEIPFIYVHSYEVLYSKSCEILWKNKDIYTKIILSIGGIRQLGIMQRLLHKRNFPKGYREWCVDAKTIAERLSIWSEIWGKTLLSTRLFNFA